jgi:hypothetical protein
VTRFTGTLSLVVLAGCSNPALTLVRERAPAPRPEVVAPTDGCAIAGGGWLVTKDGLRVSQGHTLGAPEGERAPRLQVSWGRGHRFQLEMLETALCVDDPAVEGTPAGAMYDTYVGTGRGRLDQGEGSVFFTFTDGGDAAADLANLVIYDAAGEVVLDVSDRLVGGDHRLL